MSGYWQALEALIAGARVVIDRPAGSRHPRYPALLYPLDYGYLDGTRAMDGGGIDLWRGSAASGLGGVLLTADLTKRDAEVKLLLDCTPQEAAVALAFHNAGSQMRALLVLREGGQAQ